MFDGELDDFFHFFHLLLQPANHLVGTVRHFLDLHQRDQWIDLTRQNLVEAVAVIQQSHARVDCTLGQVDVLRDVHHVLALRVYLEEERKKKSHRKGRHSEDEEEKISTHNRMHAPARAENKPRKRERERGSHADLRGRETRDGVRCSRICLEICKATVRVKGGACGCISIHPDLNKICAVCTYTTLPQKPSRAVRCMYTSLRVCHLVSCVSLSLPCVIRQNEKYGTLRSLPSLTLLPSSCSSFCA